MAVNDLGIDSAWRSRIPPGWVQFPDGTIGPPNPTNPVDSAWPTRVPSQPSVRGPLAPQPGAAGVPSAIDDSLSISPRGGPVSPYIHHGEAFSPESTFWRNPSLRGPGPTIDAAEFSKGASGSWGEVLNRLRGLIPGAGAAPGAGALNPAAIIPALTAATAAAGYRYGEPGRAALSTDPRTDAASSGGFDVGQPLGNANAAPAHPPTMRYPMWPTPGPAPTPGSAPPAAAAAPPADSASPTAPMPPPRPTAAPARPRIDPAQVDLGYYRAGVGNARTPVFVPQGQTQAPPIFRGPLATGGQGSPYY